MAKWPHIEEGAPEMTGTIHVELSDEDSQAMHLIGRDGNPLETMTIEESSGLHVSLGAELKRHRQRKRNRPRDAVGSAEQLPPCQGQPGCRFKALPGEDTCARCKPEWS